MYKKLTESEFDSVKLTIRKIVFSLLVLCFDPTTMIYFRNA